MRARMPLPKRAVLKGGADPKRGQPRNVRSRRYFLIPHWEPEPRAWSVELRVLERGPQRRSRSRLGARCGLSAVAKKAGSVHDRRARAARFVESRGCKMGTEDRTSGGLFQFWRACAKWEDSGAH